MDVKWWWMDGWGGAALSHERRAWTRVFFFFSTTVLPLGFVQIRRIPPFSLFEGDKWRLAPGVISLIWTCTIFSRLLAQIRNVPLRWHKDITGQILSLWKTPRIKECHSVSSPHTHAHHVSDSGFLVFPQHECERLSDPETLVIWASGSRSLFTKRLDCVACTTSASSTHKLPLSRTNTAITQSLLPAWCCTVLPNMLFLSYLLFCFVLLPAVPFSPPFRQFQFWSSGWRWQRTSSKSVWTTRGRSSSSSREERRPK